MFFLSPESTDVLIKNKEFEDSYLAYVPIHVVSSEKYEFRPQILGDLFFGKDFGKRYYIFFKSHFRLQIVLFSILYFLSLSLYHVSPLASDTIEIITFLFIYLALPIFNADILCLMMKEFQVLLLLANVAVYVGCECIISVKKGEHLVHFISWVILFVPYSMTIFADAIPSSILCARRRRYFWGLQTISCLYEAIKLSLFSEPIEINIMRQTWLLSDIRASANITWAAFVIKIFTSSVRHPTSMVLCSTRLHRLSCPQE